jgi:hypothetical protein
VVIFIIDSFELLIGLFTSPVHSPAASRVVAGLHSLQHGLHRLRGHQVAAIEHAVDGARVPSTKAARVHGAA